jgi:hypothetical protein
MQLKFRESIVEGFSHESEMIFEQAIEDVANLLGYKHIDDYNGACVAREEEVKERIRAL